MPELMLALVPFAQLYARPAVSNLSVGVVAAGASTGALYYGANQEYAGPALSFTLHAEQCATTNAWRHEEQGLSSLAVSAAPCGHCRQFLYELVTASDLEILLPGGAPAPLTSFLPDAFGPRDLGVPAALMTLANHGLRLVAPTTDQVVLAALEAANSSYAPYTESYAGLAIETSDSKIFAGRLAENAAYNPSLSPMQAAMALRSLSGDPAASIDRIVLVETEEPTASQLSATLVVAETTGAKVEHLIAR